MHDDGYAHCRDCGAQIRWVFTKRGKKLPLDYPPKAIGTRIRETLTGPVVEDSRTSVYTNHHATCSARVKVPADYPRYADQTDDSS